MKALCHVVLVILLSVSQQIRAASGDLDATFGVNGVVLTSIEGADIGTSVIQQSDQKLAVAGHSYVTASGDDFSVARYNSDGSLDTTFSFDGKVITAVGSGEDWAKALIQQKDGKLVVAGYSFNGIKRDIALVRYNNDGSLDTAFGGNGMVVTDMGSTDDAANSLIQQSDGKLLVVGTTYDGADMDFALVRYLPNGGLDTTFGGTGILKANLHSAWGEDDGWDAAYSVIQQKDGKLVVAGNSEDVTGSSHFVAVRFNGDGSIDNAFGNNGKVLTGFGEDDYAYSLIQQSDGKLVLAGYRMTYGHTAFALARYNGNGSIDSSFGLGGQVTTVVRFGGEAFSVIQQGDGKLVLAGSSYDGSDYDITVVRYNNDGTLDASFSGDGVLTTGIGSGDAAAYSLVQQLDGKLVVAGFTDAGIDNDLVLARYESGQIDSDADGVIDGVDIFPFDSTEQYDTDADGVGNGDDPDDDDDGIPDGLDPQLEWLPLSINAVYKGSTIKDSAAPL